MKYFAARTTLLALVLVISLGFSCNKSTQSGGTATSGSSGTTAAGGQTTGGDTTQLAANPATEFSFKTTSGSTESLSKYLGKPLVVNFWADW